MGILVLLLSLLYGIFDAIFKNLNNFLTFDFDMQSVRVNRVYSTNIK